MQSLGRHLLIEYYECDVEVLASKEQIRAILLEGVRRSQATLVTDVFHSFSPHGVSGVVVIAESHVAIHTWPEHGYAAVDIFTCGETLTPEVAAQYLVLKFQARQPSLIELKRGLIPDSKPAKVATAKVTKVAKEVFAYGRPK